MNEHLEWQTSLCSASFPAAAYEALCKRSAQSTPFNSLAWLRAAEQALQHGCTLRVLLLWQGDRLIGCLPLVRCPLRLLGMTVHEVRHLGHPLSDRIGLLVEVTNPHLLERALKAIRRRMIACSAAAQRTTCNRRTPRSAWTLGDAELAIGSAHQLPSAGASTE